MWQRIRSTLQTVLLKTPVLIALGLVLAYLLFGWFGFEPLVKWLAPKIVADKSQHQLSLAEAKFDPLTLSLRVKGLELKEPDGKPLLSLAEVFVDFQASSLFRRAYTFEDIRLVAPHARVHLLENGQLNWSALIEAFKSEEEEADKPLPRLLIRHFALEQGRVGLKDQRVGFSTGLNPLDLTLEHISTLPDDKGAYDLAATTKWGARIRWKGDMTLTPTVATGQLGIDQLDLARYWPYLETRLNMEPPAGEAALSLRYHLAWADKKLSLLAEQIEARLEKLVLRGKGAAEPAIRLDSLALREGRFDLEQHRLDIGGIALQGGRIQLSRDAGGTLDIQDWFLPPDSADEGDQAAGAADMPPAEAGAEAAPQEPGQAWHIQLGGFSLDGLGIGYRDGGFQQPLGVEVGNVQLAFTAEADVGVTPLQTRLADLGMEITDVQLSSGSDKPFFSLAGIQLRDGRADLAQQAASLGSVSLRDGVLQVLRSADGRIDLLQALQPLAAPDPQPAPEKAAATGSAWRYNVGEVGLTGFRVGVRDESVQPALQLDLERIQASIKDLSQDLQRALPARLSLAVKQGGGFQAEGRLIPGKPAADLRLVLKNLDLKPAQPFVGQVANLALVSGRVSASGRLQFDGRPVFAGGFQVDDLLLNESESGERFLAWKRLASDSLSYRPEALNIEELRLDDLGAKLIIYKDKSINLQKILKSAASETADAEAVQDGRAAGSAAAKDAPPAIAQAAEAGNDTQTTAASAPTRAEPAMAINIDRIRLENGELDFADLSLALPFGTRIHHFKGAFNGISSQPGSAAQLELDGQVDEYGLARAVGQLDLFDPTGFMDIKVVFRNVEMNGLTPYTATFVGRHIDSGKLSLDLEYKIKQRQLLGENQIIMDRLTLGERVESPTAMNLPLDLAIAILQDSDGRIDLGLPVSGSLDDPQFSYGRIIWKAITNIITKIVTAPFRALGSLFGGGGEKLEKITFEAGETALSPPEKEKLAQIATVLNKRPGLALTIHPAWSAGLDRPVIKDLRLRQAVAAKLGSKLQAGEDPGPISTANAKVQVALEGLYAEAFGKENWQKLQQQWQQANPDRKQADGAGRLASRLKGLFKKEEPLSEEDKQALLGTDLHALLYDRLLARVEVTDADLADLARQRGEAVLAGLAAAGAPAARMQLGQVEGFDKEGREVPARMELGVAKQVKDAAP